MADDHDPLAALLDAAKTYRRVSGLSEDAVVRVKVPPWFHEAHQDDPPPGIEWDLTDWGEA